MTLRARKRGKFYRLEGRFGERGRRGTGERTRIRLSLGTMNGDAAQILVGKIDQALAEGPASRKWVDLRAVLPPETFSELAGIVGYVEKPEAARPTWVDLSEKFSAWMIQRVALDKMRSSTRERYAQTVRAFGEYLRTRGNAVLLEEITRTVVEEFKGWQLARVATKRQSRGGRGIILDTAILHRVFTFAVECELVGKNPVKMEGRPGEVSDGGAQPFKAADLQRLRDEAGADLLAFSC